MKQKMLAVLGALIALISSVSFAQMNYTNLEWVDRSPIVGDSIFHSASIVVSGKLYVVTNKVNGSGNTDIYTLKIDSNGDTLWSATYNGSATGSMDYGVDLRASSDGYVYVIGAAENTSTGYDYCLIKYSQNTGSQTWVRNWNGAGNGIDIPSSLYVDGSSAIYVTGGSEATNGFADYGTIKVSNLNVLNWTQYYDYNHLHDSPKAITKNLTQIIVTGASAAAVGDWDIATVSYNILTGSAGTPSRSNISGATMVEANGMTTDALNNIYITGHAVVSSEKQVQTIKLDSNLTLSWIKDFDGGGINAVGKDIGVDASGNVYVTGYNEISNGVKNFLTIKYNSSGTEQWIQQMGNGSDIEENAEAEKVAVTSDGDVYLTGTVASDGGSKMMFIKYNSSGEMLLAREYQSDTVNYEAYDINVVEGDDVYITGLEKTIGMTRMTNLKYSVAEKPMVEIQENDVDYFDDEIIVEFMPEYINEVTINNKDVVFGDLSDFVHEDVIDSLVKYYPALNWERARTYKVFDRLTTNDSLTITKTGDTIPMYPFWATLLIEVPDQDEFEVLDSLKNCFPLVQYAELNGIFELFTDDPYYSSQHSFFSATYGSADINMPTAWAIETGKDKIKVGVYDTGIMYTHNDLGGAFGATKKVKDGRDYYTGGALGTIPENGEPNVTAYAGHGTRVAGVIGAYNDNDESIAGIAGGHWPYDNSVVTPSDPATENQGVSLYAFRIAGSGTGNLSTTMAANAIVEGSSNTTGGYGYGLDILNCSWGHVNQTWTNWQDSMTLMTNVQRQGFKNGAVLVCGTGNYGTLTSNVPSYSLKEFWVLSVGGSNTVPEWNVTSNYGPHLDVVAPASVSMDYTIYANWDGNMSNSGTFSGTSAAAPHVSGLAGLMLSHINDNPETVNNLAPDDVEFLVQRYAVDIEDLGHDTLTGYGLIDAGMTMTMVNRYEYVVKHFYANYAFNPITEDSCGTSSCHTFLFKDGTHSYGWYSGILYDVVVPKEHDLNGGDVILNYWPLNSYTNMIIADGAGIEKIENEMQVLSVNSTGANLRGNTIHVLSGPDGPVDFWYPVAPGEIMKFGYTLHLQSAFAMEEEVENEFQLSCYPNPTRNSLTVSFILPENASVAIEIVDVQGRVVKSIEAKEYNIGQQSVNLDVNNLSTGVYVIRLGVGAEYYYEKFIRE